MKQQAILQWQIIRISSILTFAWQFNKTEMTTTVVCRKDVRVTVSQGLEEGLFKQMVRPSAMLKSYRCAFIPIICLVLASTFVNS